MPSPARVSGPMGLSTVRDDGSRSCSRCSFRWPLVDRVVGGAPQVLDGVGPPRAPPLGVPPGRRPGRGGPSASAARRTPRSVAGKASGSPRARMATISAVHGPMPGHRQELAAARSRSAPAPRSTPPEARASTRAARVRRRAPGRASRAGSTSAARLGGREQVGEPAAGSATGSPWRATSRAGMGAGRGGGHLLAEDGPHGQLGPVDGAGHPPARRLGHQGAQGRVGRQEASTASGSASRSSSRRHRAMAVVRSRRSSRVSSAADVVGGGGQRHDAGPVGQRERAAVGAVPDLLARRARRWRPDGRTGCRGRTGPAEGQAEA